MRGNWAKCLPILLAAGMLSACAVGDPSERAVDEPADADYGAAAILPEIPRELTGLDARQLAALFGPADFRRIDGPAEILRYDADDCVLHVILYRGLDDTPPQVAHVEARDDMLAPSPEQPCVESVVRARHAPPTS